MSVYLDTQGHLVADDREELHAFAARIGMKRRWFQERPVFWHYDVLSESRRRQALALGASLVSPRFIVAKMRGGRA